MLFSSVGRRVNCSKLLKKSVGLLLFSIIFFNLFLIHIKNCKERENKDVQVKTIEVDFTEDGEYIYSKIRCELATLTVGVLVNNVGMTFGSGSFLESLKSGNQLSEIINCNVTSMARMTSLILPGMMKNQRGLIINIGSLSAVCSPLDTIYGATKV